MFVEKHEEVEWKKSISFFKLQQHWKCLKKLRISVKYKSTQEWWNFLLGNIGDSSNMQQQYLFSNFDQKRTKMWINYWNAKMLPL